MLEVFYCSCVDRVGRFDNLVYAIKEKIASLLVEDLLLAQMQEIGRAIEEPLTVKARQFGVSTCVTVPRDRGSK